MDQELIAALLGETGAGADLAIIEGVMGLFDGPQGARGSTADLAAMLGLPVLLVVDARHQAQSVTALVHGFATYRGDVQVKGVILNRVASERHGTVLRDALGRQVLGLLRHDSSWDLPSRHLGLVQAFENQALEQVIESAASAIAQACDLDRLSSFAAPLPGRSADRAALPPLGQTIAVASDEAFAFAYPHNLHQWREAGAEVVPFSPLADEAPSGDADAVFLPGGYPELHAGRLAANQRFLAGLRQARGLVYGECGGYMVLGEGLIDTRGEHHAMAGLLPVVTSFENRRLHLGYRQLRPLAGAPWQGPLRGHEFHYSTVVREGHGEPLFAAADAAGNSLPDMGLRIDTVMGSYAHLIAEAP
jgi:cobyrinic acid a,c-diamide synthase